MPLSPGQFLGDGRGAIGLSFCLVRSSLRQGDCQNGLCPVPGHFFYGQIDPGVWMGKWACRLQSLGGWLGIRPDGRRMPGHGVSPARNIGCGGFSLSRPNRTISHCVRHPRKLRRSTFGRSRAKCTKTLSFSLGGILLPLCACRPDRWQCGGRIVGFGLRGIGGSK